MAYYCQPYVYPHPAPIFHYGGDQPYGWQVMDYYPVAAPVQVVSAAPWGSYIDHLNGRSQRRALDYDWYQRANSPVDPTEAHNTIQGVLHELHAHVNSFNFPGRLDFEESTGDGQIPKLANTKKNSAVNEHKQKLDELLRTLEGVKPRGDQAVKRAKAEAIGQVKAEIEELKRKKAVIWYNQTQAIERPRKRFWGLL